VNCYPFIEAEKADRRNVARACALLKVAGPTVTRRAATGPTGRAGAGRPSAARPSLGVLVPEPLELVHGPRGEVSLMRHARA